MDDTTAESVPIRQQTLRKVKVSELIEAPWNHRLHGSYQRDAFGGTVEEIGWYGYPDVFESDSGLMLCDGHLRREWLLEHYGEDAEIDVNVVDFDEAEAKKATLSKDTLAQMADQDPQILEKMLDGMTADNTFSLVLNSLREYSSLGNFEPTDMDSQGRLDEKQKLACPECGHEF